MKFGIGDIVQSAAIALWRGGRQTVTCLVLWCGAEWANYSLHRLFDPVSPWIYVDGALELLGIQSLGSGANIRIWRLVDGGLHDLVACAFIAALLRVMLIGRVGLFGFGPNGFARVAGGVLLASLAVTVTFDAASWLVSEVDLAIRPADRFGLIEVGISLGLAAGLVYLAARLCLVFPSIAVGQSWAIKRNWRRTAGNGIRLSVLFVTVAVGFRIVGGLLESLVFGGLNLYEYVEHFGWIFAVKEAARSILITTTVMAFSAVAYTRLAEFPAAHIPGAGKTPAQLANTFE